jgi:hypothetical protein
MHIFEIGHKYDQLPFIVLKYNSVSTWLSVEKPINIYKHICRTWCLQHTNIVCICREWRHEYIAKSIENSYCLIYSLFLVHNATNTHTPAHTHNVCVWYVCTFSIFSVQLEHRPFSSPRTSRSRQCGGASAVEAVPPAGVEKLLSRRGWAIDGKPKNWVK